MLTQKNALSITELKRNTRKIITNIQEGESPMYLFDRSKPVGVLLRLDEYNQMVSEIEDIEDSLELLKTDTEGSITLEDYDKKRAKKISSN